LPYLEQGNKFNQFNFNFDTHTSAVNAPARLQDVPFFICPSDPSAAQQQQTITGAIGPIGRNNYFSNIGGTSQPVRNLRPALPIGFTPQDGPFVTTFVSTQRNAGNIPITIDILGITDGTSNTAMFAEVRRSRDFVINGPRVDPWDVTNTSFGGNFYTVPSNCSGTAALRYTGLQYHRYFATTSFYNHIQTPNSRNGDCTDTNAGVITARSAHTGGVNVCMCDGSVQFMRDSIAPDMWRAVGTSTGGEVLNLN